MGDLAPITGNRQPTAATPPAITAPARRLSPEPNSTLRTPNSKFPAPAPVIPAKAGNHAPPAAIPHPASGGNQPNPKNHPNQTNHSSRPSRHHDTWAMGVSNRRSHPWAGGNLLSLAVWGLRGFRRSPERREDGEGVTWIPAFAGKTAGMRTRIRGAAVNP